MADHSIRLAGRTFQFIGDVVVDRLPDGSPREDYPWRRFDNVHQLAIHSHGHGPFCHFSIPDRVPGGEGVYAIVVDGQPVYIGRCDNVTHRFNTGYGNISPRNCFTGGQTTNCRINARVLECSRHGQRVSVYFSSTPQKNSIEEDLIRRLAPPWNLAGRAASRARLPDGSTSPDSSRQISYAKEECKMGMGSFHHRGNKYDPLADYLQNSRENSVRLSFREIEQMLGESLPASARKYRPWWANDATHVQAHAWLEVGYVVNEVNLIGERVVFSRR